MHAADDAHSEIEGPKAVRTGTSKADRYMHAGGVSKLRSCSGDLHSNLNHQMTSICSGAQVAAQVARLARARVPTSLRAAEAKSRGSTGSPRWRAHACSCSPERRGLDGPRRPSLPDLLTPPDPAPANFASAMAAAEPVSPLRFEPSGEDEEASPPSPPGRTGLGQDPPVARQSDR
ncbi:unnamed protein product [Urochloa humidicola]